jgi:hypothetical protein
LPKQTDKTVGDFTEDPSRPDAYESELDALAAAGDAFLAVRAATTRTPVGRKHPCPRCRSKAVARLSDGPPDLHCNACGWRWEFMSRLYEG